MRTKTLFAHLALQETVDGNLTAVSVEGDGGEAGDGRVHVHAGNRTVRNKLRIVVQQCGLFIVMPSSLKTMVGGKSTFDSEIREAVKLRYIIVIF